MKPVPDEEELEDDDTFDATFDGYNWDEPIEIILHYDAAGHAHCEDGPAANLDGTPVWYWHGFEFYPNDSFKEDWPDDKKAWWMRAKLELSDEKAW